MKKVFILTIIALFIVTINASAVKSPTPEPKVETQVQRPVLKGIILDNQTKETLAGAVIIANGQKVYSDLDGNFALPNICDDKCQIKISMISYEDQTIVVDLKNENALQIKLQQR